MRRAPRQRAGSGQEHEKGNRRHEGRHRLVAGFAWFSQTHHTLVLTMTHRFLRLMAFFSLIHGPSHTFRVTSMAPSTLAAHSSAFHTLHTAVKPHLSDFRPLTKLYQSLDGALSVLSHIGTSASPAPTPATPEDLFGLASAMDLAVVGLSSPLYTSTDLDPEEGCVPASDAARNFDDVRVCKESDIDILMG